MHFGVIVRGMVLGLGAAAPIGPVNVEIARRTLRGGFFAGFALGSGAVTVDITYAVLTSLSVRQVLNYPWAQRSVAIAGGLLLGYLGIGCLRHIAKEPTITGDSQATSANRIPASRHYLAGLLMTALNPMTLGFWFVMVPASAASVTGGDPRALPWLCLGVFVATISWVACFAGTTAIAGLFARRTVLRLADLLGGVLLLAFAILAIARGIWRTV